MSQDTQRTSNAQSSQTQHIKSTSKAQTSPTFQQLLQREGSKWSQISTEKLKKNGNQHNKKSVIEKVKEKAKKLKHSLSIKKHRHENDPPCTSVTRVTTDTKDKGKQDVEFHGAAMPESKHLPSTNKKEAKDDTQEAPTPIPTNHSATSKDEASSSSNTIKDADSKNQVPSDTSDDTDGKHQVPSGDIDTSNQAATTTTDVPTQDDSTGSHSRFSNLTVSTSSERSIEEEENMKGESQRRDKGVSVKEYLMHKFEPGEDERALSQIITQTISPRRDKVREAMSVFLKTEDHSESTSKNSKSEVNSPDVENDTNPKLKSKSLPATPNYTEPKIASIVQSHSLGANASKNLNQTFQSTVASYQNNLNSSSASFSPNRNAQLNNSSNDLQSPAKSSSSPLGHSSRSNRTQAGAEETRVPNHSELIDTVRDPISRATQAQIPDASLTRNKGNSPKYNNASTSRVPASRNLLGVVEEENDGRILQAK